MLIEKETEILGSFNNEEYASITYQILKDNKIVQFIHLGPDKICYKTIEARQ